jgi:hypothetical protein
MPKISIEAIYSKLFPREKDLSAFKKIKTRSDLDKIGRPIPHTGVPTPIEGAAEILENGEAGFVG